MFLDGEDDIYFVLVNEMVNEYGFVIDTPLPCNNSVLFADQIVNDKVLR